MSAFPKNFCEHCGHGDAIMLQQRIDNQARTITDLTQQVIAYHEAFNQSQGAIKHTQYVKDLERRIEQFKEYVERLKMQQEELKQEQHQQIVVLAQELDNKFRQRWYDRNQKSQTEIERLKDEVSYLTTQLQETKAKLLPFSRSVVSYGGFERVSICRYSLAPEEILRCPEPYDEEAALSFESDEEYQVSGAMLEFDSPLGTKIIDSGVSRRGPKPKL